MDETTSDVVIIGAGVIGASVAYELSLRGYRVVAVDRSPTAGYGSTSSSSAILRSHYSTPEIVSMAQDGLQYWKRWDDYVGLVDDGGLARFVATGCVLVKSRSGFAEKVLHNFEALGVEHETWDVAELAEQCPMYDVHEFWPPRDPSDPRFADEAVSLLEGAIYAPGAGYVEDPPLATLNLKRAAEARGARFRFKAPVVGIRQRHGRACGVELANGDLIDAPVVINAAGPHSSAINQMAGVEADMNITTRALRQEVHQLPAPVGFDTEHGAHMTSDGDLGIYFRPAPGHQVVVGSEDPECDPRTWVDNPDDTNWRVTQERWESQTYRLARRLPGLGVPNRPSGIVGLYDVTDDWLPIYDRSSLDGFYMAVGTSGHQFKVAPVVGHLMAELVDTVEAGRDHDRDPVVVESRHVSRAVDLSAFSRLRQVNQDSSFAVTG